MRCRLLLTISIPPFPTVRSMVTPTARNDPLSFGPNEATTTIPEAPLPLATNLRPACNMWNVLPTTLWPFLPMTMVPILRGPPFNTFPPPSANSGTLLTNGTARPLRLPSFCIWAPTPLCTKTTITGTSSFRVNVITKTPPRIGDAGNTSLRGGAITWAPQVANVRESLPLLCPRNRNRQRVLPIPRRCLIESRHPVRAGPVVTCDAARRLARCKSPTREPKAITRPLTDSTTVLCTDVRVRLTLMISGPLASSPVIRSPCRNSRPPHLVTRDLTPVSLTLEPVGSSRAWPVLPVKQPWTQWATQSRPPRDRTRVPVVSSRVTHTSDVVRMLGNRRLDPQEETLLLIPFSLCLTMFRCLPTNTEASIVTRPPLPI